MENIPSGEYWKELIQITKSCMLKRSDRMRALLIKRMNDEALTEDEQFHLDEWLAKSKNHSDFFEILPNDELLMKDFNEFQEKVDLYKKQSAAYKPGVLRRFAVRRLVFRYSAAAALLLTLSAGVFYYFSRESITPGKQVAQKKSPPPPEVMPGTMKATLILADNTRIELDPTLKDSIAQQGSSTITAKDGQLTYQRTGKSFTMSRGMNTVMTPRGGSYRIALPDGSLAFLNAQSSLKFPPVFDGLERVVEITGEVYFEVTKQYLPGSRRPVPFLVKIPDGSTINVLGTKFNINSYYGSRRIIATLLEGKVRVDHVKSDNQVVSQFLSPGQRAVVRGEVITVQNTDAMASISWIRGLFNFEDADLQELLDEISRNYNVDVEYRTAIPEGTQINGTLQKTLPLSQLLNRLDKLTETDLRFDIQGNTIVVSKK